MVFDCFPFFNELDLLEIRLNELADVVDVFVLSEATLTFTGKPKPLYYEENKKRFYPFWDKIYHNKINKYRGIETTDSWVMDRTQKYLALKSLYDEFDPTPEDVIIYSDCDEIPKADKVREFVESGFKKATMEMPIFYYWMNCQCVSARWKLPKFVRAYEGLDLRKIRMRKCDIAIPDSGWHFGYLGDVKSKLESFAHTEYDKPPFTDAAYIEQKKNSGEDLFGRNKYRFAFQSDLSYLPKYVLQNMDRFGKYIKGTTCET